MNPSASSGHRPSASSGHRPSASSGHRPSASSGHRPSASSGHRPSASSGHRPSASSRHRPSASSGHRRELKVLFILLLFVSSTTAQVTQFDTTEERTSWAFELDLYQYIVPFDKDNTLLIAYADYGAVHYEARYNYEDRNTA